MSNTYNVWNNLQQKVRTIKSNVNASPNSNKNLTADNVQGKISYYRALDIMNPGGQSSSKGTSHTGLYSGRGYLNYPDNHFISSVASSSKSNLSSISGDSSDSAQSYDKSSHVSKETDPQPTYASMETCIDKNSSAKDCFDYFTLALISPITKALFGERTGKKYHKHKLIDDWTIHGLWPTASKGGEELQDWCNQIFIKYNEKLLFSKESLVERLSKLWSALYDEINRTDESFWRYQFNKHGKCATRSEYVCDQIGYFQMTFKLYDDINLKKTLEDGGFIEGTKVKLTELYSIVKKKHGCYPYIKY
ncbi:uncharacterized protein LOC141537401 isoform X2 [Cotesia typhae]